MKSAFFICLLFCQCCLGATTVFIGGVGDSIMMGTPTHTTAIYSSESGDLNNDVLYTMTRLYAVSPSYTNCGYGGHRWDQAPSDLQWCTNANPTWILFHYGINDVYHDYTWSQQLPYIINCKAMCDAIGAKMILDDIFPDSNSTNIPDAKCLIIAQWNANYDLWASTNGVYRIHSHGAMGQTRASTGNLDDLKAAYDSGDGVHLNNAGTAAWARIVYNWFLANKSRIRAQTVRMMDLHMSQ